ncbi:MAG: hypothetical protein ACXWCP_28225 [Burkholderiales bacterium]
MQFAPHLIAAALLGSSIASAGECTGSVDLQNYLHAKAPSILVGCGSLMTIVDRFMHRARKSGRRLEDDQPLNTSEAQATLNAALRDAAIRRRIEQMRREVQDENMRLAYEAAILDEEGYYNARDLRIMQLSDRLK